MSLSTNPEPAMQQAEAAREPRIIAFLCKWCTYTGADLAGTSRLQYAPNVRIILVMCSGAVDPLYVMKPLLEGVDGVLVGGCHAGDCHYVNGNYKARRRIALVRNYLEGLGLEQDRVWFRFISASEGRVFADTINEMTESLRKLGPNPLAEEWTV